MVDWDQVERLRSKGWDWERIAGDSRVEFTADAAGGDAGRQLRALYYQRRSRSQRRTGESSGPEGSNGEGAGTPKPALLLRIGYVIAPLFGLWALLTFVLPWPGIYFPFLDALLIFVIAVFVLIFALLRSTTRWEPALRTPLAIGIVLGLVIPGSLALVAISQGCPTLASSATAGENDGWARYSNSAWTSNGAPIFFFYGSIACPYCSASSWAMAFALMQFGSLTGTVLYHSNPGDTPPSVPEIELDSASLTSQYVAFEPYEGNDDTQITTPSLPSCTYQAYVTTYDSQGTIPFVVIGGTYVHAGASLVDPTQLVGSNGQPLTPQQAYGQMQNQSGVTWNAVESEMYEIEAIIVKLNNGLPTAVAQQPEVAADLTELK